MVFIKQEVPCWDDTNSIDSPFDWEKDLGFTLMDLPTSEFLTSAAEIEQTYGGSSCTPNPWGDPVISPKLQIRNHDCMWSGRCFDQSHPGKQSCGATTTTAVSSSQDQSSSASGSNNKFNTVTAVAAAVLNSNAAAAAGSQKAILTPSNTSALNINNNATAKLATLKAQAAQIPAGRSLLINSRNKQQLQQHQINKVPTVSTADFLRERETGGSGGVSLHTRPDTPLSLDEDPPEFKHNLDLATCTIGSNRLSLTGHSRQHHHHSHDDPSSSRIINMLKEQLEDTESGSLLRPYMTSSSGEVGSLTDLLNDLQEMQAKDEIEDTDDSQGEELDSDVDSNADVDADADGNCSSSSSSRSSRGGSGLSGGYTHAHHQEMSPTSSLSSSSSSSSYEYQGTHVGDHSYTRPKNRYTMNELGVQTPSDSDEEIDVVSIGEKNLPTNPTARDRRALQSHVAHKIARKQAQNVGPQHHHHHHHHRRRHSDDEYPSQANGGGATGANGLGGGSHSGSPSKHHGGAFSPNYLTPASSTSISGTNTPLPGGSGLSSSISNPRKRSSSSKDEHRSSGKNRHHQQQHRNKKQRVPGKKPSSDSSEEQETLEKRNLHNDMERQRRIGLKNLFEELKLQIPGLREKERAPKVNILREAANLCQRLNREQEQLNALRKQQQRLYARVRQLRTSLHSQRRNMD